MIKNINLNHIFEYLAIILLSIMIVTSFKPLPIKTNSFLLSELLKGSDRGYIVPGSEFEVFKKFLPLRGRISYISDHDFSVVQDEEKILYDAQNYLTPLLINPDPAELITVVNCSTSDIAADRLARYSYQWIQNMGNGKGVAQKLK